MAATQKIIRNTAADKSGTTCDECFHTQSPKPIFSCPINCTIFQSKK
jgi:hypothetical protein